MTDQPKPDPQYVDGLSREQIMEYIRELNTIAANCEVAGTAEFSRSAHNLYRIANRWFKSLPTPDAAEGAVAMIARGPDWTPDNPAIAAMFADEREDWRTDLHKRGADRDLERRTITLHADASPPKPAPDAMRKLRIALEPVNVEVLVRERLVNNGRNAANGNVGIRTGSDLHLCEMLIGQLDRAREAFTALAAPVPSPDGALDAQHLYFSLMGLTSYVLANFPRSGQWSQGGVKVVDLAKEYIARFKKYDYDASPSGTGAAAWPDHPGATIDAVAFVEGVKRYPNMDLDAPDLTLADKQAACQGAFINGFKRAMAMRAPPVREDREAIAEIVADIIFNDDLKNLDGNKQDACRHVADSLPVQPGADELEHCPVCHCAVCMCFLKPPQFSREGGR